MVLFIIVSVKTFLHVHKIVEGLYFHWPYISLYAQHTAFNQSGNCVTTYLSFSEILLLNKFAIYAFILISKFSEKKNDKPNHVEYILVVYTIKGARNCVEQKNRRQAIDRSEVLTWQSAGNRCPCSYTKSMSCWTKAGQVQLNAA